MRQHSERVHSIDMVRGLVIILMALDHSRDFFGDLRIATEAPETSTLPLFFTRFVTHFCAPAFVFLAGSSAWLYGDKITSRRELSTFLFTRGLWLIFLEFTVVYFSLALSVTILPWMFIVLGAIGVSMVALSAACWLPHAWILVLGLGICLGHNLLDGISAESLGAFGPVWIWLHAGPGYISSLNLEVGYPVLAWFGVMCLGYGIGPIFKWPSKKRRKLLLTCGLVMTGCFLLLRITNGYGNPNAWRPYLQSEHAPGIAHLDMRATLISFLATRKYPPSLAFLLMTLGPMLLSLAVFEGPLGKLRFAKALKTFGGTALFFYLLHFYVLHLSSIAAYWVFKGKPLSPFQAIYAPLSGAELPAEFGFAGLWQVYLAWGLLILAMYPLCKHYGEFRRTSSIRFWSYL